VPVPWSFPSGHGGRRERDDRLSEPEWWEYLDQTWAAADTAEHTSLTVLPALMLRAHKESTHRDDTD